MRNLGKILVAAFAFAVSGSAMAEGHKLPFEFKADTNNLPAVQRGAAYFMGYCSGCHSMKYMRYNRIGQDLKIPEDQLMTNLMFTSKKVGDTILTSMPAEPAAGWFGRTPPDLTLETRARGADWVYSYLKSFYVDPTRPVGVNNLVLPNASMPHVLWELQGWQTKNAEPAEGGEAPAGAKPEGGAEASAKGHGDEGAGKEGEAEGHHHHVPFTLVQPGKLTPEQYDKFVSDLTNFMVYASEPGRSVRVGLGFKAMLFLLIFTVFAYLLKKEYWRDVPGH